VFLCVFLWGFGFVRFFVIESLACKAWQSKIPSRSTRAFLSSLLCGGGFGVGVSFLEFLAFFLIALNR